MPTGKVVNHGVASCEDFGEIKMQQESQSTGNLSYMFFGEKKNQIKVIYFQQEKSSTSKTSQGSANVNTL